MLFKHKIRAHGNKEIFKAILINKDMLTSSPSFHGGIDLVKDYFPCSAGREHEMT